MEKFGIDEKEFESKKNKDNKYLKIKDGETFAVSFKKIPETKGGILSREVEKHKFVNGVIFVDPVTKQKVVEKVVPGITMAIDLCGKVDKTTDKVLLEPVDMIWEITNQSLFREIKNLAIEEDESGESMIFSWIFKISRFGAKFDTKYTITPSKQKKKIGPGVKVTEEKIPYV